MNKSFYLYNAVYIILSIAILLVGNAFANPWDYGGGHPRYGMMGGWFMEWLMLAFWIFVMVGLVLVIRWLLRVTKREENTVRSSRAMVILEERYAKGEITKSEFKEMKSELTG